MNKLLKDMEMQDAMQKGTKVDLSSYNETSKPIVVKNEDLKFLLQHDPDIVR